MCSTYIGGYDFKVLSLFDLDSWVMIPKIDSQFKLILNSKFILDSEHRGAHFLIYSRLSVLGDNGKWSSFI